MSDRVERALEIVGSPADVLARFKIPVKRRMACCPFHEDRRPSLSLYTSSGGKARWKCHGCGLGGDALDLEARLRNLDLKATIALVVDGVIA